jgi:hypothetical protein
MIDTVNIVYNESMIDRDMLDKQQESAFYTMGPGNSNVVVITYKDRSVFVDCVGEMYLTIPNIPAHLDVADNEVYNQEWEETIIRYTDDLINYGIDTDEKLNELNKRFSDNGYQIWHNNSWFEVYSTEDDFGYDVHHELHEAIDFAVAAIQEDEYWDNL